MFMPAASPEVEATATGAEEPRKIETGDDLNTTIVSTLIDKGQTKESLMKNRMANRVFTYMMRKGMFADATTETVEIAVMSVLSNQRLNKVRQ